MDVQRRRLHDGSKGVAHRYVVRHAVIVVWRGKAAACRLIVLGTSLRWRRRQLMGQRRLLRCWLLQRQPRQLAAPAPLAATRWGVRSHRWQRAVTASHAATGAATTALLRLRLIRQRHVAR